MAYGDEGCKPPCDLGLSCNLYEHKVDRDALLALADDMESFGGENDRTLRRMGVVVDSWASCARRIREACGEEAKDEA